MSDGSNVERDQLSDREKELYFKMQSVIHGMEGIFWALNVLTDTSVDILRSDQARKNGKAYLIMAGEQLAEAVADQF